MDRWLNSVKLKRKITDTDQEDQASNDIPTSSESTCVSVNEVPSSQQPSSSSVSKKSNFSKKVRKYSQEYLALGFTYVGSEEEPRPQCVLCLEVLSNEGMKPAKLRRHLETKHLESKTKSVEFFKLKLNELKKSQNIIKKTSLNINKNATLASYQIAELIAKSGKPHTIAEELIVPAAVKMCETMLGESAAKTIRTIPVSNNTIQRRISDLSENIQENLFLKLSMCDIFALQIDESTDISKKAIMLVFVRFIFEFQLYEDFLFSCELMHTKGEDMFNAIDQFLSQHGISWKKCVGITTDGAAAMSGCKTGLLGQLKAVSPNIKWTHCCIHREALAVKKMPASLKNTFNEVVKIINFIKSRPLQSRLFEALCKDMESVHMQLLLHTEIRWLSRGKILERFFELRDEVRVFVLETKCSNSLTDFDWLCMAAYLADIFEHLNVLNLKLQGHYVDIFRVEDTIEAIIKKFQVWANRVEKNSLSNFPTLQNFLKLESADNKLSEKVKTEISEHLKTLAVSMRDYFPAPDPQNSWIRNPFTSANKVEDLNLTDEEEDHFIDLTNNGMLKNVFDAEKLLEFWLTAQRDHKKLSLRALKHLTPFCTTYTCEQAFSTLCYMKNKYRNRLTIHDDFRVNVSKLRPNIEEILDKKDRFHLSH